MLGQEPYQGFALVRESGMVSTPGPGGREFRLAGQAASWVPPGAPRWPWACLWETALWVRRNSPGYLLLSASGHGIGLFVLNRAGGRRGFPGYQALPGAAL